MNRSRIVIIFQALIILLQLLAFNSNASAISGPHLTIAPIALDTFPIEDRYGDFITDDYDNPFDILPSIIEQTVEYDFQSGQYVVMEKIGDEYYRTPTYLTMSEYLEWQQKKQQDDYFRKLSGIKSRDFTRNLQLDPMSEIDVEALLIDRLFGGSDVEIKPTGNIDMTFGFFYQDVQNPNIPVQTQKRFGFPEFKMDINMGVEGKIGDKLNLGFNYNTAATFDFDNKFNLGYGSELFDEDDIIKNIEAGDVDFALPGQLIQGQQNLFGLKTELQFGKFWLTAVASQSRSEKESISLENGKLIQEFELRPDDYDENRHFFISHYNRDIFEEALENIPQVKSLMHISNIEVWVTNDLNNDLSNTRQVAAIEFLGESDLSKFPDSTIRWQPNMMVENSRDINGRTLPSNKNSDLFSTLVNDPQVRSIDRVKTTLKSMSYGLKEVRDFEIHNMRKLNTNEYSFHPQLGYISLNQRLRPNQVLGVAFEYTYTLNGNEVYKVGEITNESNRGEDDINDEPQPENVIFVKMLKSTIQVPGIPSWDLMMKNVYPLNTSQLTQEDFKLDIFFEDYATATFKRFIPEPGFRTMPLLNLFQLDRLNAYGDPQEDGVFDFVPGITVNQRTGSIIFPVLEPFGNSLFELLDGNQELFDKYGYPQLYNNTKTQAQNNALNKNRFVVKGEVKSNISSEISLGAFNIPPGSVTVRAGSQILREGIDYDIDYGIGRIKILNESYLQQGVPIDVSYEDQGLFNLQQKTLFGLRGELRLNENFTIGATYMRLFERPFTQKVNIGEDPINNRMFGLDVNLVAEAPGITKFVDNLPLISTDAPSSVSLSAEVAALRPGHSKAINVPGQDQGVVSLDDFEGANSGIPLGSRPNIWSLASPNLVAQVDDNPGWNNNLLSGVNRALINWYVVDDRRFQSTNDPNPYTRRVLQTELFERELDVSQLPDLRTFDISFYPSERGPYNFDEPGGLDLPGRAAPSAGVDFDEANNKLFLLEPESRWGGIMRYIPNNDFEAANYEYVEFWLMNPFMDTDHVTHDPNEKGQLRIHLGNISEDILRDELQFYENAIPTEDERVPVRNTAWGNIPLSLPVVNGFNREFQEDQDLGLDGLTDEEERSQYDDYVEKIENAFRLSLSDVANDNFVSYLDDQFTEENTLLDRYKRYNNPQGNAPTQNQRIGVGDAVPDSEDLNENRSLETNEAYYEYTVPLNNVNGEIGRSEVGDFITDTRITRNPATGQEEKWYRFQIPIMTAGDPIGDIKGFRSIQFIRLVMTNFKQPKTLRMAEFELVRNQWRRLPIDNTCGNVDFVVNEVGLQENGRREPFRYVLPRGIKQERIFSTFSNILQDENSLSLNVSGLPDGCETMISKLTRLDMRRFKRLQMFVHAEEIVNPLDSGDLAVFVRIGKDFTDNYYEYEVPLVFSDEDLADQFLTVDSIGGLSFSNLMAYSDEVWRPENFIDIPLELFRQTKIERNVNSTVIDTAYRYSGDSAAAYRGTFRVKGNPSLGLVKGMVIGLRNNSENIQSINAEVWVNEMRLQGLDNRGGVAALARAEVQLADFGNITSSFNYNSLGFGQIDQQLQERALESSFEYDFATQLELGKLFPSQWGLSIPFYYQYAKSSFTPEFDPLELDLRKEELLENPNLTDEQRTDIEERQSTVTSISTFNLTNVRKQRTGQGTPKPWDVSNLSASYSFSRTRHKDEIIKEEITDDQRGELVYSYNPQSKPIQPFKGVKGKALRFISEFNFNPIPNSVNFNTQMQRYKSRRQFRLPPASEGFEYVFDDQRFDWTRNYSLSWDLARSLKLNYDASALAIVDELRQVGIAPTAADRRWVDVNGSEFPSGEDGVGDTFSEIISQDPGFVNKYRNDNVRDFGRMKLYNQGLSVNYTLPFKYLPGLDWISAQAQYNGEYTWNAASRTALELGNVIQNSRRKSLRSTFDFEKLYDKVGYFRKLEGKRPRSSRSARSNRRGSDDGETRSRNQSSAKASTVEKIFLRPLLSIRKIRFNYTEDESTVIPGYVKEPKFFGLTGGDPGWGFVFGSQPDLDNFFQERVYNRLGTDTLITTSRLQNQQVIQNNAQSYDADITIEPWKDFSIDVDFRKRYTENHSEFFLNTASSGDPVYEQLIKRDFGSFEISYLSLNTLFDSDLDGLFQQFDANRQVISQRLENDGSGEQHELDNGYAKGFGRQHLDVLIPAFIAAYTNQDANTVDLNLRQQVSKRGYIPSPNWNLRYNGLSKLPWFKNLFSNFTISHSYKNTLNVNSFQTDLQFNTENPFNIDPDQSTSNYFARFEVPEIVITEQFQPIIGIDFKTYNDMTLNLEYSKARTLTLATALAQLREKRSTSYTLGFAWILQDVNIGFLTGNTKKRRRARDETETDEDSLDEDSQDRSRRGINSGGVNQQANKLEFVIDVQLRDDVTWLHVLDDGSSKKATRGTKTFTLAPAINYDVNKNFILSLYVEYSKTQPYLSTSYPITNINGGLTARFVLD